MSSSEQPLSAQSVANKKLLLGLLTLFSLEFSLVGLKSPPTSNLYFNSTPTADNIMLNRVGANIIQAPSIKFAAPRRVAECLSRINQAEF